MHPRERHVTIEGKKIVGISVMDERLSALQRTLWTCIPITRKLGLKAESYDGTCLRLKAPLTTNINHAGTAFAGSLSALLTLTGWGMVWLLLCELELEGEIVIQDNSCRYIAPVTHDFMSSCARPPDDELERFARILRKRGKARLELNADIIEDGRVVVSFTGRYVVQVRVPAHSAISPADAPIGGVL